MAPPPPEPSAPSLTYRQGHRLHYFGVVLIALLLQFPILKLLNTAPIAGPASPSTLGVLLRAGINMLALAALGFVGVTLGRAIRRTCYLDGSIPLIAPL